MSSSLTDDHGRTIWMTDGWGDMPGADGACQITDDNYPRVIGSATSVNLLVIDGDLDCVRMEATGHSIMLRAEADSDIVMIGNDVYRLFLKVLALLARNEA